ncbi:MAG: tyrosine-type recombinase/integrase, partial [Myxococcaceae bacterium]
PLAYHSLLTQLVIGCRFSELRAFEKRDLDITAPKLLIARSIARKKVNTPKNKLARAAPLPKALAEELRVWMLKTEGQLLFPGPSGGMLPNNTLNRWFTRLCEEAGIRRISSHGARHTSGSAYAYQGLSQKAIAQLLGHEDTEATERYTHVQVRAMAPFVEERWTRLNGGK